MNRFSLVAFEGYMAAPGTSINFNTGPGTERLLGLFDRLSLQAIVTDVVGTAPVTFQAAIVHSGNGRAFQPKNLTAEIPAAPVLANQKNVLSGADDGSSPSLAYVRIGLLLQGGAPGPTRARVKVIATLTDEHPNDLSTWVEKTRRTHSRGVGLLSILAS